MFQRRSLLFVKLHGENLECVISMFRSHSIIDLHVYIACIVLFGMSLNDEFC